MRHYEVMVILDAGLEEDVIRATVDRATQTLTDRGATVGKVDRWGKRRFAYEVHHRSEGYYVLIDTEAEPAAVAELNRMLGLADDVIRHKVVRLPDAAVARTSAPSTTLGSGGGTATAGRNENGAR
jgi:small subunit ribosomal protein S6